MRRFVTPDHLTPPPGTPLIEAGGAEQMITAEKLRALLHYDPATGIFTRRTIVSPQSRSKVGEVAGHENKLGYVKIRLGGCRYFAHRLAWLYMVGEWPSSDIDHIDLNPSNNAIGNLRLASRSNNQANTRRMSNNTSGFKGVCWYSRKRKWHCKLQVQGRRLHLGYFSTPEEAHAAYVAAAIKHFGEFARMA